MGKSLLAALLVCIAFPVSAEGILGTLQKGAEKAGEVTQKGIAAVGDAADSTTNLVKNEETPHATRAKLDTMADEVLARLLAENSDAALMYAASAGHAVFDMRRVSVFPLSAGYGRGVAVSAPDETRTYMQMGTGGAGAAFGIGGFESQFVIMFETPVDFDRFVESGFDASVEAGVMEGEDGTRTEAQFVQGRSFYVLDRTGWRVNANASGTKYWIDPGLN